MHKTYFTPFFLLAFVFIFACSTKKTASSDTSKPSEPSKPSVDPAKVFLKNVEKTYWMPNFFNGKANINVVMNGSEVNIDAVIQFRKDSAILLVVKKFGFEGGRALITPDSFFFINRLQQEYDAKPLSVLAERFNLPARFDLIQHLIIGNAVSLDAKGLEVNMNDSLVQLASSYKTLDATYSLDKKNYELKKSEFNDAAQDSAMQMDYTDYKLLNQHPFSYKRTLEAKNKTAEISADLKFNEIEIDKPKVIRFDIPKKYKRMD